MAYLKTLRDLSVHIRMPAPVLEELVRLGCPVKGSRGYVVTPTKKWISKRRQLVDELVAEHHAKINAPKKMLERQRRIKAKIDELKYRRLRGELVHVDEIKARDVARIQMVKRGLQNLVKTLPPALQGMNLQEMEAIIQNQARNLLVQFSRM